MQYNKNNINELFNDFYNYVNKIIYNIHINPKLSQNLYYCKYKSLHNNITKINYPLTFCLGGGGYILYKNIFENENLNYNDIDLFTLDYDVSFTFNGFIKNSILDELIKEIDIICNDNLKNYKFMNLSNNIFTLEHTINNDRLHYRINCDTKLNKPFHILELSFWLNGKISDNFTVNDFKFTKLLLYEKNNIFYYLLPLKLLVKTTLYAIVDFFEKRNFAKCNKYISRVKYIKKINNIYLKLENPSNILTNIFDSYINQIKRKYKMINDYPFILSKELVNIKNNGVIKCIYRHMRLKNNHEIEKIIKKYKHLCFNEKSYEENSSEITLIDTDNK